MIDKKQTNYKLRTLQRIKTWQLLLVLFLMLFLSATFLRLNNIGMIQRLDAVKVADIAGDDEITKNRLYDLQRFVSDHMNTDMGKGVYLEKAYGRDIQKAYAAASADTNPNGNIYKKAQDVCAPRFSDWSTAYIQCTVDELAKYPAAGNLASSAKLPKADSYLHVFVAPFWSPDFAGWSVLLCVVILFMIIVRLLFIGVLRWLIRRQQGI